MPDPTGLDLSDLTTSPAPPEAGTETPPASASAEPSAAPAVSEPPAATPPSAAPTPTPKEEADLLGVTPEVLERLKSTPEGMELYKTLNKKATEKFQEIAAHKKFLEVLKRDPTGVIKEMAKRVGLQIGAPPTAPVTEKKVEELANAFTKRFGKEVGDALNEAAEEFFKEKNAPFVAAREAEQAEREAEAAAQIEADVSSYADAFMKEHPDVKPGSELAKKMAELMEDQPFNEEKKKDVKNLQRHVNSYLSLIYNAASAGKAVTTVTKEVTERMKASAKASEPVTGVSAPVEKGYKTGMKISEVFEDIQA